MKSYRHILCATDFSPYCDRASVHAAKLAKESGAKLTLLHVVDYFPEDRSNEQIAPEDEDPKTFRERKARAALEQQATRTDCMEAQREVSFSTHSAAHEIVRYGGTGDIDLIVIASHGRKGITAIVGSTAKSVQQHAACEVLVVSAEEV